MQFRTVVDIPVSDIQIDHRTPMILFGSCFSENIGQKLLWHKFNVDVNPFGILYNPLSIARAIARILSGVVFSKSDLIYHNDLYHSMMHHGSFSNPDPSVCLSNISQRFKVASQSINNTEVILVTFGSAYIYKYKKTGEVVGNCHKLPGNLFQRERLSVNEIVEEWSGLIEKLTAIRPHLKLLFTVSPIRHWKEGAHENQLSKSTLLLAIDNLQQKFPQNTRYFPAYELVLDELRDYRFYNEDMVHPSSVAVDYIWQHFSNTFFSSTTMNITKEWSSIKRAMEHRPLYPGTQSHVEFIENTLKKLHHFSEKYIYIPCDEEKAKIDSWKEQNQRNNKAENKE